MTGNLIDWLSISLPVSSFFQIEDTTGKYTIEEGLKTHYAWLSQWLLSYDDIEGGQGRRVFNRSAHSSRGGFTVFWRDTLPYSLVEITGTGMAELRRHKLIGKFLNLYGDMLTRIDVSRDIECDTDPRVFAQMRDEKRFQSYKEEFSPDGISYLVGSKSSDRFALVYRYKPPHPRAHLLRVEHRLKDEQAKITAKAIMRDGLAHVVGQLGNTFGWTHPAWSLNPALGKAPTAPRDSKQGKTERWLLTSVVQAVDKVIKNGGDETVEYFLERCYALLNDYRSNRS